MVPVRNDEAGPGSQVALQLVGVDLGRGHAPALRSVDLHVGTGERVVLIGPNGQGVVSTAARMCAQIVSPYPPAGRIGVASQSGNLVSSYLNYAVATGVGISKAVSFSIKNKRCLIFTLIRFCLFCNNIIISPRDKSSLFLILPIHIEKIEHLFGVAVNL